MPGEKEESKDLFKLLVVMAAPPGSDATGIARDIEKFKRVPAVNLDPILYKLYGDEMSRHPEDEPEALDAAYRELAAVLEEPGEHAVVYNASNCTRSERESVLEHLSGLYTLSVCAVSAEELGYCKKYSESAYYSKPAETAEEKHRSLHDEPPRLSEGFDYIVDLRELDEFLDLVLIGR